MGESSKILGILGILFGIVGVGLGGYTFYTTQFTSTSDIKGTWYDTNSGYTCPHNTWAYIDPLEIDFSISSGENLYILLSEKCRELYINRLFLYLFFS